MRSAFQASGCFRRVGPFLNWTNLEYLRGCLFSGWATKGMGVGVGASDVWVTPELGIWRTQSFSQMGFWRLSFGDP